MSRQVPEEARLEIKFVAGPMEFDRVRQWLVLHPACFQIPFPSRWVNNVYFDTYDYYGFSENLSGASYRTKLRYRWYGLDELPQAGVLEVKCKRNYFGWKLRYKIDESPCSEGGSWSDIRKNMSRQVGQEAKQWLEANPQPVMINRYYRHYFVTHDNKVRATIDVRQSMYDQRYKPWPNISKQVNNPDTIVIEFKFHRSDRLLASQILQSFPLRVSRNSKYMVAVKSMQRY